jgi:hypothetical protein
VDGVMWVGAAQSKCRTGTKLRLQIKYSTKRWKVPVIFCPWCDSYAGVSVVVSKVTTNIPFTFSWTSEIITIIIIIIIIMVVIINY